MPDPKDRVNRSQEWLYLRLIEYLYYNRDREKNGYTRYHLSTKIPDLHSQRQDRVSIIIEKMINNGHLDIVLDSGSAKYYNITKEGIEWYIKLGKDLKKFLETF